jgi:hypothetical protein
MKFHKSWDGTTPVGEAFVRVLEGLDMPFAHKFGTGVQAYKKGEFSETHVDKLDAGIVIMGQVQAEFDSAAPSYTSWSVDLRSFADRGEFVKDNVDANNALVNAGAGYAFVFAADAGPQHYQLYRTRDGKSFKPWVTYTYSTDPYGLPTLGGEAALYRLPDGRLDWTFGFSRMFKEGGSGNDPDGQLAGTWLPQYFALSDKVFYGVQTPYYINHRHGAPWFGRAGPKTLVSITRVYRRGAVGSSLVPTADSTPRSFITVSFDNGETWGPIDETNNNTFVDLLVPHATVNQATYNSDTAALTSFAVRPLNRTQCYIMAARANAPYTRYVAKLDLTTLTLSDIHAMAEPLSTSPGHTTEPLILVSAAFSQGQWLLSYADYYLPALPVVLRRTEDFTTFETVATTFPGEHTGAMMMYDEKFVMLPRYEPDSGLYAAYETKDVGTTWKRRCTIRKGAAAPPTETPHNPYVMQRFNNLVMIRKDGLPATDYPSIPWARDERRTAPEAP